MADNKPPIDVILEHYGADLPALPQTGYAKFCCVMHSEDNPSATVNLEKGTVRCFVCDWSGDGYALIMQMEGCDFVSSVARAEEITGFCRDENEQKSTRRPELRTSLFISNRGTRSNKGNARGVSTRRRRRLR